MDLKLPEGTFFTGLMKRAAKQYSIKKPSEIFCY